MKNEPAFPQFIVDVSNSLQDEIKEVREGMTLRDYFAAQAMLSVCISDPEKGARECYKIADAMLREREK